MLSMDDAYHRDSGDQHVARDAARALADLIARAEAIPGSRLAGLAVPADDLRRALTRIDDHIVAVWN